MSEGEQRYSYMIRDMPTEDRPRERLLTLGPASLTNAELLAIILNTGMRGQSVMTIAQSILNECGGIGGLMRMSADDLDGVAGLGPAKSAKLLASLELGRRSAALAPESRPNVGTPEDIVRLLGPDMMALDQEQLRVILLDTKNQIIRQKVVYQGSVNGAQVRLAELFREAIRANAVSVVLVHNHPSGDPTPSPQDIAMTRDAVAAGKLLDVAVLDHIIIGQGRHVSLKRLGLGFSER